MYAGLAHVSDVTALQYLGMRSYYGPSFNSIFDQGDRELHITVRQHSLAAIYQDPLLGNNFIVPERLQQWQEKQHSEREGKETRRDETRELDTKSID